MKQRNSHEVGFRPAKAPYYVSATFTVRLLAAPEEPSSLVSAETSGMLSTSAKTRILFWPGTIVHLFWSQAMWEAVSATPVARQKHLATLAPSLEQDIDQPFKIRHRQRV